MTRRTFLAASVAAPVLAAPGRLPIQKAVLLSMLPRSLPYLERFRIGRDAGFELIECPTTPDRAEAEQIRDASRKSGLKIHSVMNQAHWKFPLSSADPAVVAESRKGMETSLENAAYWGADAVLLVPAVVNAQTSYRDAWIRSQERIRELVPLAAKLKVIIAVEEVWNKFLLSPLEFVRYVDDFHSPWVRAYFDVGNVVISGYPQDWIRTLGKRILKLHFKDFQFKDRVAKFVNLGEGEIDWLEIHKALGEIGFQGPATVELTGGDAAYLKEVSRRVDRILAGEKIEVS